MLQTNFILFYCSVSPFFIPVSFIFFRQEARASAFLGLSWMPCLLWLPFVTQENMEAVHGPLYTAARTACAYLQKKTNPFLSHTK